MWKICRRKWNLSTRTHHHHQQQLGPVLLQKVKGSVHLASHAIDEISKFTLCRVIGTTTKDLKQFCKSCKIRLQRPKGERNILKIAFFFVFFISTSIFKFQIYSLHKLLKTLYTKIDIYIYIYFAQNFSVQKYIPSILLKCLE